MSFGEKLRAAMADPVPPPPASPMFTGGPYQVLDFIVSPPDALAAIEIDADGGIEAVKSAGNQGDIGRWDGGGSFNIADYDFRMDPTSGVLDGPFLHSVWYAGSGGLITFKVQTTSVQRFTGTLRMRPAGGGADIDTSPNVDLNAEGGV